MQSDLEDLKRSNSGFEKENISLVKERNTSMSTIQELKESKHSLETKLQTSNEKYAELLEAKETEQKRFEEGIGKLIKFKNQVKDLLDKNKKQQEETTQEKE